MVAALAIEHVILGPERLEVLPDSIAVLDTVVAPIVHNLPAEIIGVDQAV